MNNSIDTNRFLKNLDMFFNKNDLPGAGDYLSFWENEARNINDEHALLTILNEYLGYCRRTNNEVKALKTIDECKLLIEKLNLSNTISAATIYINAATTYYHFGNIESGLILYEKARKCYVDLKKTDSYEYATLLNNSAGALTSLKKYDDAEKNYLEAIEILKHIGNHESEIALSLVMIAHITFDKTDNADDSIYNKVESLLDEAYMYLKSDNIIRNGNFAFILDKCAPSFDYFKRPGQANAMRELSKQIYNKTI